MKNKFDSLFKNVEKDLRDIAEFSRKDLKKNFKKVEDLTKKRWQEFKKNKKKAKYLIIAEYPMDPKKFIYCDSNYAKKLRSYGVLVIDVLPFTVKYKKRGKRYDALLEECSGYYLEKLKELKNLKIIDKNTKVIVAYRRLDKALKKVGNLPHWVKNLMELKPKNAPQNLKGIITKIVNNKTPNENLWLYTKMLKNNTSRGINRILKVSLNDINNLINKINFKIVLLQIILILLVLLIVHFSMGTRTLWNDKEQVDIRFTDDISYAKSLTVNITPHDYHPYGAHYEYIFEDVNPKEVDSKSIISIYLRKRLPDKDSIQCYTIKNKIEEKCGTFTIPENNYPNKTGITSPLNIKNYLQGETTTIVLKYYCSMCNPGAFQLTNYYDRADIWNYYFTLNIGSSYILEGISEEKNTRLGETFFNNQELHFKGDLSKFKEGEEVNIFFRINAKNFWKEMSFWVGISILAGIILYDLGYFFRRLERKN